MGSSAIRNVLLAATALATALAAACGTGKVGDGAGGTVGLAGAGGGTGATTSGGTGATTSGGTGATTSGGTGATTSGGGTGATTSGGTGGGGPCTNGATQSCYEGPIGTDGVGICKTGTTTCSSGTWGPCEGQTLPSDSEICNGQDDDCDGLADEELGQTSCGQGTCAVSVENCVAGQPQQCQPKTPSPTEKCDGVDDDCDGTIDEGCACVDGKTQSCYSGAPATQGVGPCKSGTQTCTNGAWGACSGQVIPKAETCNGVDDDCDGTPDDGNPGAGQSCDTGKLGVCKSGAWGACTGGSHSCVQSVQSSPETCDGQDNDCDGTIDDGNPGGGQACTTNKPGICAPGTTKCTGGSVTCEQNVPKEPQETCDGLDNDCDGQTDEGCACINGQTQNCYTGPAGTQGVGICKAGTSTCNNGQWGACSGQTLPTNEVCSNSLDDDCNGQVNNGCGTTGLILFYELEQTSGTTVPNSATGQPNGTINGLYQWGTTGGAPGSARHLSILAPGINNVNPNLTSVPLTNATIEFFWKYDNATATTAIPYMWYNGASFRAFTNGVAGTGIYVRNTPGGTDVIYSTSVQDGQWHHIAYVLNASSSLGTLYVDGASKGTSAYSGALTLDTTFFVMGRNGEHGAKVNYDRFRLWSQALTPAQLASIIAGSL